MRRPTAAAHGDPGGRSFVFAPLLAVGLALVLAAPASAQFSAQPVIIEMRPGTDTVATSAFTVRNEGSEPLQLQVYAVDFDQPTAGGHVFTDLGTQPRSCRDRLQYYPDNLELAAGRTGEVDLRMAAGDSTCWSIVFVQTVSRASSGIRVAQRIGIKVYGVAPDAAPEGEVSAVAVVRDSASGGWEARVDFHNTGAGPVRPEGELEIRTSAGDLVRLVSVPPFSVLPGHVRRTVVPLEGDLPPGDYLLIPILDIGAPYLAGGQASFHIPGP